MKRIIYIVFVAWVLSLVPATNACAQGSAGKIETPKERKARLEREAAARKRRQQEEAAKRKRDQEETVKKKREQEAREQEECKKRLSSCERVWHVFRMTMASMALLMRRAGL